MKIVGTNHSVEPRTLFSFGRIFLSLFILSFAFHLLSGTVSKQDDLKSYYNFWQHLAPRSYGGRDSKDELKAFAALTYFELQRSINILSMILGAVLMLADSKQGCLLCLISIGYYTLVHINPFINTNPSDIY